MCENDGLLVSTLGIFGGSVSVYFLLARISIALLRERNEHGGSYDGWTERHLIP